MTLSLLELLIAAKNVWTDEMSKDEIKGLLNLADIFCFQLYVKIPLFKPFDNFDIFLTDRPTDRPTDQKGDHRSSSPGV